MNSKDNRPNQRSASKESSTRPTEADDTKPDDTLENATIPSGDRDTSSAPAVPDEHQDFVPPTSEHRNNSSYKEKYQWKLDDFIRNLLVAVTAALIALGAAYWYEDKRFERLYDEVTFRYFDAISRVLDGNQVSRNPKKKQVYFSVLNSIGNDVEHIRQNKIFAPGKGKTHELAVLQTLIAQAISLREFDGLYANNILFVMEPFCNRYEERILKHLGAILQKNHSDRTANEHVIVNAQLICDANFKKNGA